MNLHLQSLDVRDDSQKTKIKVLFKPKGIMLQIHYQPKCTRTLFNIMTEMVAARTDRNTQKPNRTNEKLKLITTSSFFMFTKRLGTRHKGLDARTHARTQQI